MTTITSNYSEARFTKSDSALLLIDHQFGASCSSTDAVLLIQVLRDGAATWRGWRFVFFETR